MGECDKHDGRLFIDLSIKGNEVLTLGAPVVFYKDISVFIRCDISIFCHGGTQGEGDHLQARNPKGWHLGLGIPASRNVRNNCLLFEPRSSQPSSPGRLRQAHKVTHTCVFTPSISPPRCSGTVGVATLAGAFPVSRT